MIHNKLRNVEQFDGDFTDEWILGVTDARSLGASGTSNFPTFAQSSDFTAAAATQAIVGLALNIGDYLHNQYLVYVESTLAGPAVTAATLSVGVTGATTQFLNAVDVWTNPLSAGGVYIQGATGAYITTATGKQLLFTVGTTGANLSVLTAGRIHIFGKISRIADFAVAPAGNRYE